MTVTSIQSVVCPCYGACKTLLFLYTSEGRVRKIDPFAAHYDFMFSVALKKGQEESALPNFKSAQAWKHFKVHISSSHFVKQNLKLNFRITKSCLTSRGMH